jgi:serine/threonine protein kinase
MGMACRHCSCDIDLPVEQLGRIFTCPSCDKLNILLKSDGRDSIIFGDYDIIQEVGEGANAIVFKALKRQSDEIVALKLFHSDGIADSHAKKEFFRESEFATELDHRDIVQTRLGQELNGILFLELEFIDGINLAEYLENYGSMDQYEALTVGTHVCYALDFVWSNYLCIHRDIKPQNVMLDGDGNVKVLDFGMVTAHENAAVDISAVEGTPYYLSPECITEGAYQDNRSDIYSLGATLYHLMTDIPPFDYDSLMEVINARLKEDPPDIRDVLPDADPNVAEVIRTMMARNPDDRYVTAFECLEDMQRVKNREKPNLVDTSRSHTND